MKKEALVTGKTVTLLVMVYIDDPSIAEPCERMYRGLASLKDDSEAESLTMRIG